MKRLQYMLTRVAQGLIALMLIATVNFLLVRAAPGDPVAVLAGEAGASDAQFVAQLRAQFGLDQPLGTQLQRYLGHVVEGDLGFSYRQQAPVLSLILERLPATLLLTGSAFALSLLMGITLGALAARRAGSWVDSGITVVALLFYATPLYWLAMMAVLVFSVHLDWLPAFGYMTVGADLSGWARVGDTLSHLLLPAVTLALFYMAVYARMTRASMREVAQMDFIKTARAKGVAPGRILRAHVLRNALLPVLTVAGLQFADLLTGTIVVENVFVLPGVGRLVFQAVSNRDLVLVRDVVLVLVALVVAVHFVLDLLHAWIDPRWRSGPREPA